MMGGVLKMVSGFFSGGSLWWIIGVAAAALVATVGIQTVRLDAANARIEAADLRVARWRDANIQNLETIERLRRARYRIESALFEERARRSRAENEYRLYLEGVDDAPDDGCVGPAVRGLFDRLRNSAGTDSGNRIYRGDGSG
jgi:hypothetical protein